MARAATAGQDRTGSGLPDFSGKFESAVAVLRHRSNRQGHASERGGGPAASSFASASARTTAAWATAAWARGGDSRGGRRAREPAHDVSAGSCGGPAGSRGPRAAIRGPRRAVQEGSAPPGRAEALPAVGRAPAGWPAAGCQVRVECVVGRWSMRDDIPGPLLQPLHPSQVLLVLPLLLDPRLRKLELALVILRLWSHVHAQGSIREEPLHLFGMQSSARKSSVTTALCYALAVWRARRTRD